MGNVPDLKSPWREAFEERANLTFDQALRLGAELYEKGHPWHAHEVWEELWQAHEGLERKSLQGLIQLAAARHHAQNNNSHGMRVLLERCLANLSTENPLPELDHDDLKQQISELLEKLDKDRSADAKDFPELLTKLKAVKT